MKPLKRIISNKQYISFWCLVCFIMIDQVIMRNYIDRDIYLKIREYLVWNGDEETSTIQNELYMSLYTELGKYI